MVFWALYFSFLRLSHFLPHSISSLDVTRHLCVGILFFFLKIIQVGFIEHKIDTNPLMRLSPRRDFPGTDMGQHSNSARQGITKAEGMPA